jgi:serine phosphatase RsbU (regulator of sigma subunit)
LTYREFWRRSAWNFLLGTLIAVVPAFAFYPVAFNYTSRQLGILVTLAGPWIAMLLAVDLVVLWWVLTPVRRALAPNASAEDAKRGIDRLLSLPVLTLPRVFGPHAITASLLVTVLVRWSNRAYGLGIPESQFLIYWLLNLTVVPIGHVVYEYHAAERLVQQPLESLLARTGATLESSQLVRLPLASRIFLFSALLGLAPPVIGGFIAYQRTRAAGLILPFDFIFQVVAIGSALAMLWLLLLALVSREVGDQTRAITRTLERIAGGDLEAEAPVKSISELGQIALAVNTMTAGLRDRERLQDELNVARTIQQGLLPRQFDGCPHFQVTGVNLPCLAVGGDYFDVMQLDPEHLAFLIADVSGKGLGAALVTALLQGTFSTINLEQPCAGVFTHMNRFICAHAAIDRFATLYFGLLDSAGELEFINAGHWPPLIIHNGDVREAETSDCVPVGLFADAEFRASKTKLNPGDTLVLFTDGVPEALNRDDEFFGPERLHALVTHHANHGIHELQSAVVKAVEDFTRGTEQRDDITLLVIRYAGLTAG